jgi:hypothetical protein
MKITDFCLLREGLTTAHIEKYVNKLREWYSIANSWHHRDGDVYTFLQPIKKPIYSTRALRHERHPYSFQRGRSHKVILTTLHFLSRLELLIPIPLEYSGDTILLNTSNFWNLYFVYRLCGLVVKVPDYIFRGPALPDFFLRSSWSGTGSTQPPEDN